MTIRKNTPYLDDGAWECHGCSNVNVRVVRVGEIHTIGEGDFEMIHPESPTAWLCKACLERALACFDA